MTGSYTLSQQCIGSGAFAFYNVPLNSNIILTPYAAGYTFTPITLSSASLKGNWTISKFFGTPAVAVSTSVPIIFYSDIESGPVTGGRSNQGTIITITGRNFGYAQGTSSVSLNGIEASEYLVWSDTTIAFQPGAGSSTGDIIVHRAGENNSNGVLFTVRPGNLYFVNVASSAIGSGTYESPWKDLHSFFLVMSTGDICYIRGGTYSGKYMDNASTAKSNFLPTAAAISGTASNPICWAGYPGEVALFSADGSTVWDNIDIEWQSKNYYRFINLKLTSADMCVYLSGTGCALINCTVTSADRNATYSATIRMASGDNLKVVGNLLTGNLLTTAMNGRGYDFRILDVSNSTIAWNTSLATNDNGVGPMIYLTGSCPNINIFSNRFNGGGSSNCRAMTISGNASVTMNIYNNIFENVGTDSQDYGACNLYSGDLNIYNNVFYNMHGVYVTGAACFRWGGQYCGTINVKNNIIYSNSSTPAFYHQDSYGTLTTDYNDYWLCLSYPADTNSIAVNPLFLHNGTDYHLTSNSGCIGKGTSSVTGLVTTDKDGNDRTLLVAPAIGAYEYLAVITPPIPYMPPSIKGGGIRCLMFD